MNPMLSAYQLLDAGDPLQAKALLESHLRELAWQQFLASHAPAVAQTPEPAAAVVAPSNNPAGRKPPRKAPQPTAQRKPVGEFDHPLKSQPMRVDRAKLAAEVLKYQEQNHLFSANQLAKALGFPNSSSLKNLIDPPDGVSSTAWAKQLVSILGPEILAVQEQI